jgi:hypothetical protein
LRPAAPNLPANPALKAANDGRDVGCLPERLPSSSPQSPPASTDIRPGPPPPGSAPGNSTPRKPPEEESQSPDADARP